MFFLNSHRTAVQKENAMLTGKGLRPVKVLSPGQTDRQVVASARKLNLRRDLRWVAKRTRKFPPRTRKSQK